MMAKPMKSLELHYPMIQFLIIWNTLQAIDLRENDLFLATCLPRCMLREIPANTA